MQEIIQKVKLVSTSPRKFFANLKEEKIGKPLSYYAVLLLVRAILGLIIGTAIVTFIPRSNNQIGIIPAIIVGYAAGVLISFVIAAIIHLWIKLFGGKGNFTRTYQLFVYADTPNNLLGWIPVVGIIVRIWGLVLLIIGTQELHKIKKTTAILMYVIPVVILFILGLTFVAIAGVAALAILHK